MLKINYLEIPLASYPLCTCLSRQLSDKSRPNSDFSLTGLSKYFLCKKCFYFSNNLFVLLLVKLSQSRSLLVVCSSRELKIVKGSRFY